MNAKAPQDKFLFFNKQGGIRDDSSVCGCIKIAIRRVSRPSFLTGIRSFAGLGFLLYAALTVDSLDARHPAENPFTTVTRGARQLPRCGLRFRLVRLRHHSILPF